MLKLRVAENMPACFQLRWAVVAIDAALAVAVAAVLWDPWSDFLEAEGVEGKPC